MRRSILFGTIAAAFFLAACGGGGGGGGGGVLSLGPVQPWYPAGGADWNDYLKNDGGSLYTASDTAATGTEAGNYSAVIHGGEMRAVAVTGVSACGGVTAADALGAFDWACVEIGGAVSMVSTGLDSEAALSDLIDFSTAQFKENTVTVYRDGEVYGRSEASAWWSNPIVVDNDGGTIGVNGTIYIATEDPRSNYNLQGGRFAFVAQPGLAVAGTGAGSVIINGRATFAWIEGEFDASGNYGLMSVSPMRFSVLRNVSVKNALNIAVGLDNSSGNVLENIAVSGSVWDGIVLGIGSRDNILTRIRTVDNGHNGISLVGASGNLLAGVISSNNGWNGIYDNNSTDNTIQNATLTGNGNGGIYLPGSDNVLIMNVLAANNALDGIQFTNSTDNTVYSSAFLNNNRYGLNFSGVSSGSTITDPVIVDNNNGAFLTSLTADNAFTGEVKLGNTIDCVAPTAQGSGLMTLSGSGPCIVDTSVSTAVLVEAVYTDGSFAGKVVTDDAANLSDASGAALYGSVTDWTSFENGYRAWGLDGSTYPAADHRGRAVNPDDPCRIWDWSLALGDTGDAGGPVLLQQRALPSGNDTLTHEWSDLSSTAFLAGAVEMLGDGRGNDNGLCESGEWCLYTPNLGDYQGHGAITLAGTIGTGEVIEDVVLLEYTANGQ